MHTSKVECALFYPNVVPPTGWLKQTLLYYDVVGSVVHNSFMDEAPADITWLIDQGVYETVRGDDLSREAALALVDDLADILAVSEEIGRNWTPNSDVLESLNYGKLPDLVESQLVSIGMLRKSNQHLLLQPYLLPALICLIAKYASVTFSTRGRHYSMHTTLPQAQDISLAPIGSNSPIQDVLAVTLQEVFPVPDAMVSFEDILEFRTQYRLELLELRSNVEAIIAAVLTRGDKAERAITALLEQIEIERMRLHSKMRAAAWETAFASAVITALTVSSTHIAPGTTPWLLSGVGTAALSTITTSVRRRPAPMFSYLHKSIARFG